MKILDRLYAVMMQNYEDISFEVKEKTKILISINCFLIISSTLTIVLSIFMNDIPTTISLLIGICFYIGSFVLIRIKKFKIASHLNIIFGLVACLSSIFFLNKNVVFIINYYTLFSFLILIESCLIAYSFIQPLYVIIFSIIVIICIPTIKNTAGFEVAESKELLSLTLITAVFLYSCSGILILFLVRMVKRIITFAAHESEINKNRYIQMEQFVNSTRKSLEIGETLNHSSNNTLRNVSSIKESLDTITKQMDNLKNKIQISVNVNQKIVEATSDVKEKIFNQNASVTKSSAWIEEMTSSIRNLSILSSDKQNIIRELTASANEGGENINRAVDSINNLMTSAHNLFEINNVILNISQQTDLLAMNAAIEAAHAGDFGRGFSVVADEIHKLADDANANTNIIGNTLDMNIKDIRSTFEIFQSVSVIFKNIIKKIEDVNNAISEIISGMNEMSNGTGEILSAVEIIQTISEHTRAAIDAVENSIQENSESIRSVDEAAMFVLEKISSMVSNFDIIVQETQNINQIGITNKEQITAMGLEIEKIRKTTT